MLKLLRDLTPLNRVFCSSDYDRAAAYLRRILPFKVHRYPAADEYNGWAIPPKWDVVDARIMRDGKVLYDGTVHPLRVIALSKPFRGEVGLEELRRHLHYDVRYPDAVPFHFRQQYRSWERDWGFCVPKKFYDRLLPGRYQVVIETRESPGVLKVLELAHPGRLKEAYAFVAHLDHPGMANDDLAGCAVGVELFKRLARRKTKFTYKLFLLQEIMGSEYWWGRTNAGNRENIVGSLFLEMLGSATPLVLQESMDARSGIERAVLGAAAKAGVRCRRAPSRSLVCNDESVWEAYGVPMASLSRCPYPEYHCDRDSFAIMSGRALKESLAVVEGVVDSLEAASLVTRRFSGTVCLSNPRYGLYVDPGESAFGTLRSGRVRKLRRLMDLIPMLRGPVTVRSLADQVGLPEAQVLRCMEGWAAKRLVKLL